MDYFVSVNQNAYHDWQIELLIESFREHGLNNKLTVMAADLGEERYGSLCNITSHEGYIPHISLGSRRGVQKLDEIYDLMWLTEKGKIGQHFCMLKPHMVLKHGNMTHNFPLNQPSMQIAVDPYFTFEEALKCFGNFCKNQTHDESHYQKNWIPVGNAICFSNMPQSFFNRLGYLAERMALHQIMEKREVSEHSNRIALTLNIIDHIGAANISVSYNLISSMSDGGYLPLIDYSHGVPPVFNKSMFTFAPPAKMSFGDPIEVLASCKVSPNADYMSSIAQSLLKRRLKSKTTA